MDTDHDKIIRTEEKVDAFSDIVYQIRDNHLVHIATQLNNLETKVDSINTKLAMWSGGIVVALWIVERFLK